MAATDKVFAGSVPGMYERYLVPLIFDPYARDMAERVGRIGAHDVLETAAGTGVVTRAIAKVLPRTARLVVTDLNQAMIDVARGTLEGDHRIEWRQADALSLPFTDHSFDVVICQFGVMFFPDKRQGFKEAHRVLRPSGTFLFNVWDSIADNEFADVVTTALEQMFPDNPPRFLARTPHGHYDANVVRGELIASGFSNVDVETVSCVSRCASPHDAAFAYCQGSPLRGEIIERNASGLEEATQRAAEALAERFGAGPIAGRIQAIVFSAAC